MAIVHRAEITPSKLDTVRSLVSRRPWGKGVDPDAVRLVAAYRFDDPDGEVGMEGHLVDTGDGRVLHVPLTYRGAPLEGLDDALVTTMDHSVLGERWIYDAVVDPVYLQALASVVLGGVAPARHVEVDADGNPASERETTARVVGGGSGDVPAVDGGSVATHDDVSLAETGGMTITVAHVVGTTLDAADQLTGTWEGQASPAALAGVARG